MADNKNGHDEFEDIFSSSKKDEFEDIFSDSQESKVPENNSSKKYNDDFDDIFSGRDDEEDKNFGINSEPPAPIYKEPQHRDVNVNPERQPYSYNYNKSANERAKRVSDEHGFQDVSSGKQVKDKTHKKHKHVALKVIAVILVVILAAAGGIGAFGYSKAKSLLGSVNYSPLDANKYIDAAELAHSDSVKNILLIGVDARDNEDADETRSDTMMIVSIDSANKQIKLTSILRDTYIEIPGWAKHKINAAQSHGGRQLLVDTIEYNFKIDIDNYMLVNFEMFTTIIDDLGGVDVAVTEKEAKYINSGDHMTETEKAAFTEDVVAGDSVHFNGIQALWYSRIRYLDSDFYRTQRQRKVITAIVGKATKAGFTALYSMMEKVMPMVETDLTQDEMVDMGKSALSYLKYDIVQMQIPAEGTWKSVRKKGDGDSLVIDLEKNTSLLNTFIYQKAEVPTTEKETK